MFNKDDVNCGNTNERVKMNSIKWPAPNIWLFIAQLVEHCSANAEAMGSNPVSGLNLQLLKIAIITAMVKSLFQSYV